jgi:hypothetical protein
MPFLRMSRFGVEQSVKQLNRDSTLAHRRGDPLARAVANIASRENRRHARFEKEGTAFQRPRAVIGKIGAGEYEALLISMDV